METPEEFVGSNSNNNDQIHMPLKGRRTKRMRLITTCGAPPDHLTSSSSTGGAAGDDFPAASSSISVSGDTSHHHHQQEMISSDQEEEDMANCLILLAQGGRPRRQILEEGVKIEGIGSNNIPKRFNFDHMAKAGFYVYECKTCNRTFPSFQALGGHRASHKKPKPTTTTAVAAVDEPEEPQFNKILPSSTAAASVVQIPTKPAANLLPHKTGKIHECSICGLEFTSGQALGGHMRRHRATAVSSAHATNTDHRHHHNHNHNSSNSAAVGVEMKGRNILELDLNLPAPEEDLRETKFQFTATPQTIVFSAPTLVDCHY